MLGFKAEGKIPDSKFQLKRIGIITEALLATIKKKKKKKVMKSQK